MKQVLEGLNELQVKMEEIELHLSAVQEYKAEDLDSLNQAEALLQKYHQQVTKLENIILQKRVSILEKKVTVVAQMPPQEVSP